MEGLKAKYFQGVPVRVVLSGMEEVSDYEEFQTMIIEQILQPATDYQLTWTPSSNLHVPDFLTEAFKIPLHATTILPSPHYQQAFLKELIRKLEQINQEVHEFIIALYMKHINLEFRGYDTYLSELLSSGVLHKKYYTGSDGSDGSGGSEAGAFILTESKAMIGAGTTGLRTWQASLMLGRFLLDHPELVHDLRVLELGAGVGFLGLILRQLSPSCITLTDFHPSVLKALTLNILLNPTKSNVPVMIDSLDWHSVPDSQSFQIHPNLIVGADVTYDPETIRPLVNLLHKFITASLECRAYIACTVRNQDTFTFFLECLESKHLQYSLTNLSELYMPSQSNHTSLYYYEDTVSVVNLVHIFNGPSRV